ncbi:MAG: prolipoprotein diacylglyceryl transferase family protein [Rhodoferax sp.]
MNVNLGPFAIQVSHLLLLVSIVVAAIVGHLVGRRDRIGISNVLMDMLLAAMLTARIVFVAIWFDQYREAPWSIFDIRDGGFTPWAGIAAAIGLALWRGSKRPELRRPLSLGLIAGALTWAMSGAPGMLGTTGQKVLPSLELKTLAGESSTLASISHGKPMVVNLWATWCPPCRREMPVLAQAQQDETEVVFVFVNQGEDAARVQDYLRNSQLKLDHVLMDSRSELGRTIGSNALPLSLFYDAGGRLLDTHTGALSMATLAAKLRSIRSQTGGRPDARATGGPDKI